MLSNCPILHLQFIGSFLSILCVPIDLYVVMSCNVLFAINVAKKKIVPSYNLTGAINA